MTRLIMFMVLLAACEPVDEGLMIRNGLELHQDAYPVTVELLGGEDLDQELVDGAVAWWAEEAGFEAFTVAAAGEATVDEGYVPCDDYEAVEDCPSGIADVAYDDSGGILACAITISADIAYHRPTLELVLRHEMGHCLGLEDDPPSLDLRSIMSDPPVDGAGLTDHDRGLL